MLSSLHIRNYVLIDSLDISFPEGLVIITGQTGAGKSILLGALSLLTGAKTDASVISQGAENCVVEAEFDVPDNDSAIRETLSENDVEWDEGHLIVRRVVSSSGRTRCFINDSPVQTGVLGGIASHLIDIHSQHKSLLLTDRKFQLSMLDSFAGNGEKLKSCKESWMRLQHCRAELDKLLKQTERMSADREYNEAQFHQLDAAKLQEGELEELEEEQKRLSNAESIKEGLGAACDAMDSFSSLKDVRRSLEHISRFIPSLDDLCQRIESARIELDDIRSELEDLDSKVDMSPERLQTVEDRMSLLYSLMKKHSCSTVAELIAVRERYGNALFDSDTLSGRIGELSEAVNKESEIHRKLCLDLHESRAAAAPKFAGSILESLHYLELDNAKFVVDVEPSKPDGTGSDNIVFKFSANSTDPVEVEKCASGGEISRIMLCLKAMMAGFSDMPTLIFDEIDTGVSGSVADRMGSMICDMGHKMQVFSITHLPQVAAKGDAHYVVTKKVEDGKTVSGIHCVCGDERILEIARLLSGSTITPEAIANAKSLIGHNA